MIPMMLKERPQLSLPCNQFHQEGSGAFTKYPGSCHKGCNTSAITRRDDDMSEGYKDVSQVQNLLLPVAIGGPSLKTLPPAKLGEYFPLILEVYAKNRVLVLKSTRESPLERKFKY